MASGISGSVEAGLRRAIGEFGVSTDLVSYLNAPSPTTLAVGTNDTDRVTISGIYKNPSAISVSVPSIADNAAENIDSVAVNVASAFSIQPAVGDAVIPIPLAALPTDCLLLGCYVTGTDEITLTFGSKEAGSGVTGASVNFNFLVFDLTP